MYHTLAIILKKEEWNEADWLVTALTKDFGKIRLLAQGARKHGAKLQGHLEPGTISEISFVVGRNGYRLTTAWLGEHFPASRTSLIKAGAISYILRCLDANLMEERTGAAELFTMATRAVERIAEAEHPAVIPRVLAWFAVGFADRLGILPGPESREAAALPNLFALARQPLLEVEHVAVDDGAIPSELAELSVTSGGAFHLPAPIAVKDFAI